MKSRFYTVAVAVLFFCIRLNAQNIFPSAGAAGIGTTKPDSSSLFEVKSTSKGILIPRMTSTQRNAIVRPATGLLIYQTNSTSGFYYFNGSAWTAVTQKSKGWLLTGNSGTNSSTNFIGTTDAQSLAFKVNNTFAGLLDYNGSTANTSFGVQSLVASTGTWNTAFGWGTNSSNTSGSFNTSIGRSALGNNTTGSSNTAMGHAALLGNINGGENTAIGWEALLDIQTGSNNTALGSRAGWLGEGSSNTFIGQTSGFNISNGSANTFVGQASGYNISSGSNNVFIGQSAGYSNTTAGNNVGVGQEALTTNVTGGSNTALGGYALHNSTDNDNTAVGYQAAYSVTTGHDNTATGYGALIYNTTGYGNTAVGLNAIPQNTGGFYNTAVGEFSLYSSLSNGNTALGYGTDVSSGSIVNSTAIGVDAIVNSSSTIVLGYSGMSSIGGYVNWTNFSDGRYKQNIKQNVPGLAFINKLNPVTYTLNVNAIESKLHSNQKQLTSPEGKLIARPDISPLVKEAINEKSKVIYTGFVAQDVEKAAKEIGYDFSGVDKPKDDQQSFYGLRYGDFVVPLVKAVQELSAKNDSLQNEIEELKKIVQVLAAKNGIAIESSNSASLRQNVPNPFNQSSAIHFCVPSTASNASIVVTDAAGKTIKQFNNLSKGSGAVTIEGNTLSSGSYLYSLIVDGKTIATKQMILTH
jgi:hypothetical protein